MITCYLDYTIDPNKLDEFSHYAKLWIHLVNEMGGDHHGYFIPHEGANNKAYALFSFPSLAAYETYRISSMEHPACVKAYQYQTDHNIIRSYKRNFLKPILK